MEVMIVGALGQLGMELRATMPDFNCTTVDMDGGDICLDITDAREVVDLLTSRRPEVVIDTAALHDLALCETSPDRAFDVNANGAMYLARACAAIGARMVYISTDYVYDGIFPDELPRPYTEQDLPSPLNVYAASKLAGEHLVAASCPNHIIIRTAALYGAAPCRGKGGRNFIDTMLRLAETHKEVKVVTDEFTTPTSTASLARQIRVLVERGTPGLYHATCQGMCSWYDFAQAIFEETRTNTTLVPATSEDFQTQVHRPRYSVLDNKRLREAQLDIMPPWREALKQYTEAGRREEPSS